MPDRAATDRDAPASPSATSPVSDEFARRIEALRDEHCYITSVDTCCHCGSGECDGIGCIASLDADHEEDHEAIENLHDLLRQGQAWLVLRAILEAGEQPLVALMLTEEALAVANNQTINGDCEECGRAFPAQAPCDLACTACRLAAAAHFGSSTDAEARP